MNPSTGDTTHTLTVNVEFRDQKEGQELPSTQAYLFDPAGRLVDVKSGSCAFLTYRATSLLG